jgi:hypothetical protein
MRVWQPFECVPVAAREHPQHSHAQWRCYMCAQSISMIQQRFGSLRLADSFTGAWRACCCTCTPTQ